MPLRKRNGAGKGGTLQGTSSGAGAAGTATVATSHDHTLLGIGLPRRRPTSLPASRKSHRVSPSRRGSSGTQARRSIADDLHDVQIPPPCRPWCRRWFASPRSYASSVTTGPVRSPLRNLYGSGRQWRCQATAWRSYFLASALRPDRFACRQSSLCGSERPIRPVKASGLHPGFPRVSEICRGRRC
jgi:hypothetical protein